MTYLGGVESASTSGVQTEQRKAPLVLLDWRNRARHGGLSCEHRVVLWGSSLDRRKNEGGTPSGEKVADPPNSIVPDFEFRSASLGRLATTPPFGRGIDGFWFTEGPPGRWAGIPPELIITDSVNGCWAAPLDTRRSLDHLTRAIRAKLRARACTPSSSQDKLIHNIDHPIAIDVRRAIAWAQSPFAQQEEEVGHVDCAIASGRRNICGAFM